MTRHVAAVAVALCFSSIRVSAQAPVSAQIVDPQAITVNAATNVHKSPTTASAIVGTAPRGTVLEISRSLGSWVQVPWPGGDNGLAYVHVSSGTIARYVNTEPGRAASMPASQPPAPAASVAPLAAAAPAQTAIADRTGPAGSVYVALPRHVVGLGGRMNAAPAPGFGATARTWWRNRLGLQFEMSRDRFDRIGAPGSITSIQFAPSVLYSLPDSVTAGLWLRPYAGGGASLYRATVNDPAVLVADIVTEKGLGFQTFGGVEATFAGMPRFAVSADIGYRWSQTTLGGLEPSKVGFALSGHWYVK
jgi:hypothetical protein